MKWRREGAKDELTRMKDEDEMRAWLTANPKWKARLRKLAYPVLESLSEALGIPLQDNRRREGKEQLAKHIEERAEALLERSRSRVPEVCKFWRKARCYALWFMDLAVSGGLWLCILGVYTGVVAWGRNLRS